MNLGMYEGKNIDINEVIDSAETVPFLLNTDLLLWKIPSFQKWRGAACRVYEDYSFNYYFSLR